MRKNISITNQSLFDIYNTSSNASKLIEEATLYYLYAIEHKLLNQSEIDRIFSQKLLNENSLKILNK